MEELQAETATLIQALARFLASYQRYSLKVGTPTPASTMKYTCRLFYYIGWKVFNLAEVMPFLLPKQNLTGSGQKFYTTPFKNNDNTLSSKVGLYLNLKA